MLTDNVITIANGGTTSTSTDIGRITNPVLFRFGTTTNTVFDIEGSLDNSQFEKVRDRLGNKITLAVASGFIYLEPEVAVAMPQYIRVVGTLNEGAERVITVFSRDLV